MSNSSNLSGLIKRFTGILALFSLSYLILLWRAPITEDNIWYLGDLGGRWVMAIILLMNLSFAIWGYLSSGQRMRKLEKWIESRLKPAEWKRTIILMSGMLWVNFFYLYLPTIVELEVINRVTGGIFSKTYSTGLLIFFISVLNLIALLTMKTVTNDQQGNFWKDFYKLGSSYLSRMMIVTYLGIVVMTVIIHNLRKVF